jgi:hypothetical protein
MDKSIAIIQLEKHMGLTVSAEAMTTTIWLTRKEAEKLMELLKIELACTGEMGDDK